MRRIAALTLLAAAVPAQEALATPPVQLFTGGSTPGLRASAGPTELVAAGDGVHVTLSGSTLLSGEVVPGSVAHITRNGTVSEPVAPAQWGAKGPQGIAARPDGTFAVALSQGAALGAFGTGAAPAELALGGTVKDVAVTADGRRWATVEDRDLDGADDQVAVVDASGTVVEHRFPPVNGFRTSPSGIAVDAAGRVWVALHGVQQVAVLDPAALAPAWTRVALHADSKVRELGAGPDGRMWATDEKLDKVYALSGTAPVQVASYPWPYEAKAALGGITAGPDGAMWIAGGKDDAVARLSTAGQFERVPTGLVDEKVGDVATGADGNVWFTVGGTPGRVGRVLLAPEGTGTGGGEAGGTPTGSTGGTGTPAGAGGHAPAPGPGAPARPAPGTGKPATPAGAGVANGKPQDAASRTKDADGFDEEDGKEGLGGGAAAPVLGKRLAAAPAAGEVKVTLPGGKVVPLAEADDLPVGATIDTRKGHVKLRTAIDAEGTVQTAEFWGGVFRVQQTGSMTELHLRGPLAGCPKRPGAFRAAAKRRKPKRRLWGKDDHGKFRTHGRDSVATVRGTQWLVEETCEGTTTRVRSGAVAVRSKATKKVVLLRAGRSLFVPRKRP